MLVIYLFSRIDIILDVLAYSFLRDDVIPCVAYFDINTCISDHLFFFFFKTMAPESLMKSTSFKHKLQNVEDRGERILNFFIFLQN